MSTPKFSDDDGIADDIENTGLPESATLTNLNLNQDDSFVEGYGSIDTDSVEADRPFQRTIEYELKDYADGGDSDKASADQFELLNVLGQGSFG